MSISNSGRKLLREIKENAWVVAAVLVLFIIGVLLLAFLISLYRSGTESCVAPAVMQLSIHGLN